MLTAKRAELAKARYEYASRARQTRISGGSSDTEQNELAVKPYGRCRSSCVVTTVTPDAKRAIAARNDWAALSFSAVPGCPVNSVTVIAGHPRRQPVRLRSPAATQRPDRRS